MRVTKHDLRAKVVQLNEMLGRPAGLLDIGHISLDSNHIGYQLEEELNGKGLVYAHTGRMEAREMYYFLEGMIKGGAIMRAAR